MHKAVQITKETLIPIGAFFAILGILISAIWFLSGMATKVDAQEKKDSPSRVEFNTLGSDVKEIKVDVKELLRQR